jgi:TetR/AcrR family transcriptional repressor of nem operon
LAGVLEQGRSAGDLHFAGEPLEVARLLVSSLEGAMLVARSFGDVSRFQSITERLLGDLRTAHQVAATAD